MMADDLQTRLEAMRKRAAAKEYAEQRACYISTIPVLQALDRSGVTYRSDSYRRLQGHLNQWAHDPAKGSMLEEIREELHFDPDLRHAQIATRLRHYLADDDPVTVIIFSEQLVLELSLGLMLRHLPELLASSESDHLAFASSQSNLLVWIRQSSAAHVSEIVLGRFSRASQKRG